MDSAQLGVARRRPANALALEENLALVRRMGAGDDPLAVLDSRLRVRGIDRLRVCDLSAMPDINAGNTNAPAMMLGSRCAEFLLGG